MYEYKSVAVFYVVWMSLYFPQVIYYYCTLATHI